MRSTLKRALVLGGADCVWDDATKALELFDPDLTIVVNDIGIRWARFDWWATLHPEHLPKWAQERQKARLPDEYKVCTYMGKTVNGKAPDRIVDYNYPGIRASGSSGLLGVKLAQELGATHVVCAGIPMEPTKHFFGTKNWTACEAFRPAWTLAKNYLTNVRSMSGWTLRLLGPPTEQWINETPQDAGFFIARDGRQTA